MLKMLFAWVGHTDLRAPKESDQVGVGPIAQAVRSSEYDDVVLLADCPDKDLKPYLTWLGAHSSSNITVHKAKLRSPVHFGDIYENVITALTETTAKNKNDLKFTFHLSPGTPAMAAVWIIISKTRFPAELIESSREHGVRTASVPFDISADFIPDLLRGPDEKLGHLSEGLSPKAPEFTQIVHRSRVMERVIAKARRVAPRSVPVLIEGESGTGKEMLARAIHAASPRKEMPFIPVNCGAIPSELVESELFGHVKGAFTGADKDRKGYFEAANRGTLFLDEIGELPMPAQVKLLRTLQERKVVRLGSTRERAVDVRIIAATNRNLLQEVSKERFRSDIFYRLAVAVLTLPPLRERNGDVSLLVDHLLAQVNRESIGEPGFKHKKISAGAKNLLLKHPWPGNVRELLNTIRRAAIFSSSEVITREDMLDAIMPMTGVGASDILGRPLGESSNLPDLIEEVVTHYLSRALEEAGGNKTKAAELVNISNYQTFTNWMKKYGIEK